MGMFDDLRCECPLPAPGANDLSYQTKDTPNQYCDQYVIRADGTLWHEEYDLEDHSDPNAEGLMKLIGCATRVNKRWVQDDDFTGEIRFYDYQEKGQMIEFSSYFVAGTLKAVVLLRDTRAQPAQAGADRVGG